MLSAHDLCLECSCSPADNSGASVANAATQVAARPRLVAKSASGHRSTTPKALNMANKNGRNSGPDPNQVWNRNRG